jgi:hypothetical protein
MTLTIADVAGQLESEGLLIRDRSGRSGDVAEQVRQEIGRDLPRDLKAFYREGIARVGDFLAVAPVWRGRAGWAQGSTETTRLLHAGAVPIFSDGCGSYYGLDLQAGEGTPAVYFFDHEDEFRSPRWAAGSSLARFLLLLAQADLAQDENRPARWELAIDPDLERCARAPAIWAA